MMAPVLPLNLQIRSDDFTPGWLGLYGDFTQLYRDYCISHKKDVINQPVSWNVTMVGFDHCSIVSEIPSEIFQTGEILRR